MVVGRHIHTDQWLEMQVSRPDCILERWLELGYWRFRWDTQLETPCEISIVSTWSAPEFRGFVGGF